VDHMTTSGDSAGVDGFAGSDPAERSVQPTLLPKPATDLCGPGQPGLLLVGPTEV